MAKKALLILLTAALGGQVSAYARDSLARFDGAIGVIPATAAAGTVNGDGTFPNVKSNVVRGVNPGAGPWTIAGLKAEVDVDGQITVKGRGLLLASGNSIGTNANQHVFATLICEAVAPFVEHSTALPGVALEPNGDFTIDDTLTTVPSECPSPVLLDPEYRWRLVRGRDS